jgi:hypothetical protein
MNTRFSRRAFLAGVGASAAMVPLLHAERALSAGFPKRFVSVIWTNGVIQSDFYPMGTDLTTATLGQTLQALVPYKAKMLMPKGLDQKVLLDLNRTYDGHFTYPSLLTGTGQPTGGVDPANGTAGRKGEGPSLDYVLAQAIAKSGAQLVLPELNLGIENQGDTQPCTWSAPEQQIDNDRDPQHVFQTLFASAAMSPAQMDTLKLRRQSVLDYVHKDLTAFGARLGKEDQMKIAAHMSSIEALERLLGMGPAPTTTCMPPMNNVTLNSDVPTRMKAMFTMAAIALQCDLTRVVTIEYGTDGGGDETSHAFLGLSDNWHKIAHAGASQAADKIKIDAWIFSNVATLVGMLDSTMEGTGTALDNSVIMTATDMNDGADHFVGKIPFLLIGSCGGYFKTGKVVQYPDGTPHNKLLATIGNAMGVPMTGFGAAGYEGTLPELTM